MRTSNILIIAAFIVGLTALLLHDSKLKAVYLSKSYLDPLNGFEAVNFKDFNAIDVNAGATANVKIVQGPYKVMIKKNQANFIRLSQKNGHLAVDAEVYRKMPLADPYYEGYRVYISCPSLTSLTLNNTSKVDGKVETDSATYDYFYSRKNIIHGFKQDSLTIVQDNGSYLIADSNTIGTLTVKMGESLNSSPNLLLRTGNNIRNAHIDIHNKSYLQLYAPIPNLEYTMDDSSKIYFTGAANKMAKR